MYHEMRKKEKIGRRPIGQYVGDFCSVPRGGVKGKWRNRPRTDKVLCRESSPCATKWPERKKKKKNKDSVGGRLSNKFGISLFSLCPLRWRKKEKTHLKILTFTIYVGLVVRREELNWVTWWLGV